MYMCILFCVYVRGHVFSMAYVSNQMITTSIVHLCLPPFLKRGFLFIMALARLSSPLEVEDSRFHLSFCHRYLYYKSMLSRLALCELWVSKLGTLHVCDAYFIHWALSTTPEKFYFLSWVMKSPHWLSVNEIPQASPTCSGILYGPSKP